MISRLRTGIILLILAVVVWLFAESESLGEAEQPVRIEFGVAQEDREQLIVRAPDFDGRIVVSFLGAQSSIQRARSALEAVLRLEPGMPGIPDAGGRHTIRLIDVFRQLSVLRTTGVSIELVQPQQITIEVEELTVRSLPIIPVIPELEIDGEITVTPNRAEIRLPVSLAETLSSDEAVYARVPPGRTLPPGEQTLSNISLSLPDQLANARGATLLTRRAALEFTVRSTIRTEIFDSVPVQVLLPPVEMNDWRISLDVADQFVRVEISGPSVLIEQLRSGETRLVAVFSLTDVELAAGISSKPLHIMILTDTAPAPLPEGLTVTSSQQAARFTIQRLAP